MTVKSTLMLVEDEAEQRNALRLMFEAEGYTVLPAETAERALELLRHEQPDMVVIDVRLPGIDGFALFDQMRIDTRFKSTPFLFITGFNDPASVARVIKLGAVGYITKPYKLETLMEKIREHLPLHS